MPKTGNVDFKNSPMYRRICYAYETFLVYIAKSWLGNSIEKFEQILDQELYKKTNYKILLNLKMSGKDSKIHQNTADAVLVKLCLWIEQIAASNPAGTFNKRNYSKFLSRSIRKIQIGKFYKTWKCRAKIKKFLKILQILLCLWNFACD